MPSIVTRATSFLRSIMVVTPHAGPVLRDNSVRAVGATRTTVLLEWELRDDSLPVTVFRIGSGSITAVSLPIDIRDPEETTQQFLNLEDDVWFNFTIQARGENSSRSPVISRPFFVGQITRESSMRKRSTNV